MSTPSRDGSSRLSPYGSAKDLPSYQELSRQIRAGKLVTLFVGRAVRRQLLEIEQELTRLTSLVDDFYDRLGPRNWIFHDLLPVDQVERLLAETPDAESAERHLIEIYRDTQTTKWWITRLRGQDGLRQRLHQIERARKHYDADEFDSCVLQLIAVMDGFVNDFEPAIRRGLASRDPEDMTAWNSVVGHHLGLTHVMSTFTRTIKKRVDSEVFEVYRHGIVHGSVVNFDNIVVATKAWNMLFAVADWASATVTAAQPPEPEPSWREVWSTLTRHAAYKECEGNFSPASITPSDPGFDNDEVVLRAIEFLDAWSRKRWALVAAFTPPMLLSSTVDGTAARFAKDVFGQYELASFAPICVAHDHASSAEIRAAATVNGALTELRFRMVLWTPDSNVAMPTEDGATWRLAVWAPNTFLGEAANDDSLPAC
jgi:hypothetical protein